MQTYLNVMLHAGRSFCLTMSAEYAVCKMFSLCPACHHAGRPWAGSWAPKRRTPRHNMEAPGPSWACQHTHRVTQLSAEHREGTQPQPHGWELPPCWSRHSCNSTAGSPSKKRQQGLRGHRLPPWPTMALTTATRSRSRLSWSKKLTRTSVSVNF